MDFEFIRPVDLTNITRNSNASLTEVFIHDSIYGKSFPWLKLGESSLEKNRAGSFRLKAYLTAGVTDAEHSSAYALILPLIGVDFDDMYIYNNITHLIGWVDSTDIDTFCVPLEGYNPMELPEASVCKDKACVKENPSSHIIVPEGYYTPHSNRILFNQVKGHKVSIRIGPNHV